MLTVLANIFWIASIRIMLKDMFWWLVSCRHTRTTFPQTRRGYAYTAHETCLDCGQEIDHTTLVPTTIKFQK